MKLYVETFGEVQCPTVLMLHGSGAPPKSLSSWAKGLATDFHVLLPHRNGYGQTGVHEYDAAAELEALLDIVDESTTLVGHSFGSYRAFQLAALASDRIERVVAFGPIAGLPEEAREAVEGLAALLRSGADITEAAATRWLTPEYLAEHPEAVELLRDWIAEIDNEIVARENLEVLDGGRTLRAFVGADVPTRMYVGEADQATPPALAHAIDEHVAAASVTVVSDMGHLPMIEDFDGSLAWLDEALTS